MNRKVDAELLHGFLAEVTGYLPAIHAGVARFRDDPTDAAILEEPYRFVHTIKGAASMIGLTGLSHIAYQVEELVDELRHGQLSPTADVFAGVEFGLAAVETYLQGIQDDTLQEEALVRDTVQALREVRGLPADGDSSADGDVLPVPNFNVFDTAVESPPLGEMETATDGELPIPDFAAIPDMPDFTAPPTALAAPVKNDIAQELLEVFRLEAEDHLRVLTAILPTARKGEVGKEQWLEVRRAAHTLKGAAAMVGFADVTTLAHRMEDLLDRYYEGDQSASPQQVDLLLASTDAIEDAIAGRPAQFAPLLEQFAAIKIIAAAVPEATEAAPPVEEPVHENETARRETGESYVRVPLSRLNDIVKLVGELVISRTAFEQRMSDFHQLLDELEPSTTRLRRASTKIETGFEARALAGSRSFGGGSLYGGEQYGDGGEGFDALEFDRYTEFHLLSRELAETTNDIQTLGGELGYLLGDFEGHLTRQSRLGSEIEDKLMRLRMVPLSTVAARLHRTVRNAAQQTGKAAELVIVGERTGLDKAVLEAMNDPLLHLLRNAVDHGLESGEVRRALGKPEVGTVTLTAGHEGSQVVLTISDDGRGIDAERVRATAVERGLVSAEAAPNLTHGELFDLLFTAGFSTKGEVSELSGRGVGLDVVRSKVEGLKGTVHISSTVGRGTSFVIRLPMTLAVARALLVRANQQTFAIPLESVEQIVRLEPEDVQRIGGSQVYRVGEHVYPITPLAQLIKLKTTSDEPIARPPMVLLKAGDQRLAVVVDQLVGGREIVIKNLGSHLKRVPGVSGATLMGDGSVVLILNPAEFVRQATTQGTRTARPETTPTRTRTKLTVLVVDDSPSVRRVLTNLVERNGWTAVTAKDGLEALETLQKGHVHPDIVLSDIEMPRMDGYELLGTIRSQPATRTLPVVMITSRSADKHRKRAMDLGAAAYVIKPYQDESLTELVRQLTAVR